MPDPQAINKNIIGATQLFTPPNTFPTPADALFWQQHSLQHSLQQHISLLFFFDITIYPPSYKLA